MQKIGFTVHSVIQRPIHYTGLTSPSEDPSVRHQPTGNTDRPSWYVGSVQQTAREDGQPVPILIVSPALQTIGSVCETFLFGGIRQTRGEETEVWVLGADLDIAVHHGWDTDSVTRAYQTDLEHFLKNGEGLGDRHQPEEPNPWMNLETVEKWLCEAIANLRSNEKVNGSHG